MTPRWRRLRVALIVSIAAGVFAVAGGAGAVDGTLDWVTQPSGIAAEVDTSDPDAHPRFGGASDDGGRVFFTTRLKLTADDSDSGRLDVYERAGGVTTLVSGPSGVADPDTAGAGFGGASDDGGRVFFETFQKLTADDSDSGRLDVYERAGGVTTLVSRPSGVADPDTGDVFFDGASADGGRVFFITVQKLTADDSDSGRFDVYERAGGVTTLVSQPSGIADPDTDNVEFAGASADGGRVFFDTTQQLTADDTDTGHLDVYERAGGVTTLVSQPSGITDTDGALFNGASADGGRVFFQTSQKLTADDTDSDRADVYERAGGVTTLVSQPSGIADPDTDAVEFAGASADGSRVFFTTTRS